MRAQRLHALIFFQYSLCQGEDLDVTLIVDLGLGGGNCQMFVTTFCNGMTIKPMDKSF